MTVEIATGGPTFSCLQGVHLKFKRLPRGQFLDFGHDFCCIGLSLSIERQCTSVLDFWTGEHWLTVEIATGGPIFSCLQGVHLKFKQLPRGQFLDFGHDFCCIGLSLSIVRQSTSVLDFWTGEHWLTADIATGVPTFCCLLGVHLWFK